MHLIKRSVATSGIELHFDAFWYTNCDMLTCLTSLKSDVKKILFYTLTINKSPNPCPKNIARWHYQSTMCKKRNHCVKHIKYYFQQAKKFKYCLALKWFPMHLIKKMKGSCYKDILELISLKISISLSHLLSNS